MLIRRHGTPLFWRISLLIPGIMISLMILSVLIVQMKRTLADHAYSAVVSICQNTQQIAFPYKIAGTPLIAERTAVYDGPFVEDGSNMEVSGIMALVLRNTTEQMVDRAEVTLFQGQRRLVFRAEKIPAGAAVLVLEANRSLYKTEECSACTGVAVCDSNINEKLSQLVVEQVGDCCLLVTNMADESVSGLRVYHKGWLEVPAVYIGGIAYMTQVGSLNPGESIRVYPEYYVAGNSKIVAITAE